MFSEEIENLSWQEVTDSIYAKNERDVRVALSKDYLDIEDLKALVSPAAELYIEKMASMSRKITLSRFGKTMQMYIPLYLTNSCANACVYCGFGCQNKFDRIILKENEILNEYKAIKALGPFENLLLVTGENPAKAGVDYLAKAIDIAKPMFSNINIEVMPLSAEDYSTLKGHGLNGVVCFQETYNKENYKNYHPVGKKSDFYWRVNGFDRMCQAELHRVGMGALIGLEKEWRTEIIFLAMHLRYLQKHYWKTKFSINFPRMRPSESGYQPNVVMTDKELAQITFAMRIFDNNVDISYSTRENKEFRDNMATLGVTSMSAESKTDPGGYATYVNDNHEQFKISDERTAKDVAQTLTSLGLQAVWKDWDQSFDNA